MKKLLENLEVIIEINKWYDYETDFESEQLQRGINTTRNAESLIKIGYNSHKDLIFYEKIKTYFTDKSVEKEFSYKNFNWNVLFKIERDELVKYEKEQSGFDNFLKQFKERIKLNYDYLIFECLIHYIKEPNINFAYYESDLVKSNPSKNHKYDGIVFTATHEFEVEIQNRGLRYIKEYKRNE